MTNQVSKLAFDHLQVLPGLLEVMDCREVELQVLRDERHLINLCLQKVQTGCFIIVIGSFGFGADHVAQVFGFVQVTQALV